MLEESMRLASSLQDKIKSDPHCCGMVSTFHKDPTRIGIGIRDEITGLRHAMVVDSFCKNPEDELLNLVLLARKDFMPASKSAVEIMAHFDSLPKAWRELVHEYGMLQVMLAQQQFDEKELEDARAWLEMERSQKQISAAIKRD